MTSNHLYTVSDVCQALGIFKNTLYNWEKRKKIPTPRRDPMSGWRVYTNDDVQMLRKISGR